MNDRDMTPEEEHEFYGRPENRLPQGPARRRKQIPAVTLTAADEPGEDMKSLGTVRGRVETLSRRGGLTFRLYELATDSAVVCYMDPDLEDTMRGVWGHIADVTGTVIRDATTDRPLWIRRVTNVDLVDEGDPSGYLRTRGAVHASEPAEVLVRRMRDED